MIVEQKICYMFNKFFSSFVKELKNLDDTLKTTIKKHYKVIDKSSEEYYEFFWNNVKDHIRVFIDEEDLTNNEAIKDIEIIQGITIQNAVDVLKENNLQTFWNYVNILIIFAYIYTEFLTNKEADLKVCKEFSESKQTDKIPETIDEVQDDLKDMSSSSTNTGTFLLFLKVVKILSMIQNSQDPSAELADIIDDDIKSLVSKIKVFDVVNEDIKIDEAADTMPVPPKDFLESIENSKIANIAKEISQEIDISNISIEKPEDVAKLMDFSGSNNFLGNIVSKVSTKLTEKISSGEINQDDLLSEAMSMMGMLNGGGAGGAGGIADILKNMGGLGGLGGMLNNPMMNEMMKMAKKGKVATKNTGGSRRSSVSTRDRLRKKLEEKNKKSSQEEQ
jgi:hypothetical protein